MTRVKSNSKSDDDIFKKYCKLKYNYLIDKKILLESKEYIIETHDYLKFAFIERCKELWNEIKGIIYNEK